ncbi:Fic/DOC domain protein [Leptospira interrogans serovar Zanoni str. LT2156]|uniref:Fic/DOC domain protein n=1 Tax=Leptospira interrogans serovar Zanoni str. LT2156 TaxID=1001601 RepID=M6HE74_LEPIR|nr:Fic/DOC domain protein [Leptospira interrogans serovar Zanoni str. LT2156]
MIREIHGLILKNIDDEEAGVFRRTNVRITGASHIPPNAAKVYDLIQELVEWFYHNKKKYLFPNLRLGFITNSFLSIRSLMGTEEPLDYL